MGFLMIWGLILLELLGILYCCLSNFVLRLLLTPALSLSFFCIQGRGFGPSYGTFRTLCLVVLQVDLHDEHTQLSSAFQEHENVTMGQTGTRGQGSSISPHSLNEINRLWFTFPWVCAHSHSPTERRRKSYLWCVLKYKLYQSQTSG